MTLVQQADLNDNDKERLKIVRQYLKVTTIAELFDNDGKTFHRGAFAEIDNSGNLHLRQFHTPLTSWPLIPRPSSSMLHFWTYMITKLCKNLPPLGNWILPQATKYIKWKYTMTQISPTTATIVVSNNNTYSQTVLNNH